MANTTSAKKAARKMLRRTEVNKSRRSRLKAYVRRGRGGAGLRRQGGSHERSQHG
jgi:ribosomal protein S20